MPPTCPLLAVAGDGTLLCHPFLLHAHPGSGQAGADLEGTHVRAATLLPHKCADQGGRGTLYLQPCRKKCPTLLQSFLPGEVMLCWGFCTIQILLLKVAGIMVAMFIPLADAIWQ